jgi:hypothetical protein
LKEPMNAEQQHLSEQQAKEFRQRKMNADEKARWERHMAGCHDCLELVYGEKTLAAVGDRLVEALISLDAKEEFHLSMPELRRYARGAMDEADRTIFESHLEDCSACRETAESLAAAPPGRTPELLPAQPQPFWHRIARFWKEPRFALPAGVAVLAACIFLGWAVWHRGNTIVEHPGQSTGGEAAVAVSLRDGGAEITLDKKGTLGGVAGLDPAVINAVRQALASAGLPKPQVLSELSGPPIKFMGQTGPAPPFVLISPVDTVVGDDQPTLRWEALSGATSYTVAVFDPQFKLVTKTTIPAGTEWRVPIPLRRGAIYFWQVTARKGELQVTIPAAPAPRAEFKVLDSQTATDLEKARTLTDSHLVLGILYAQQGLRLDAERELDALARQNPQSSVPAKLLSDVRSW